MQKIVLLLTAILASSLSSAAVAEESLTVEGTIQQFECGDNCYLTIATSYGEETGLCYAVECDEWFFSGALPPSLVGKLIRVSVGVGMTVDGGGNSRGLLVSFDQIDFID